jgi:predicted transcriptional regulator
LLRQKLQEKFSELLIPKAKSIMSSPVIKVNKDLIILEAMNIMIEKHVGSVIVIKDGNPIGTFSLRNIMNLIMNKKDFSTETKIEDLFTNYLFTVKSTDKIDFIMNIMKEKDVRRIGVMDSSKLVGIISQMDIRLKLNKSQLSIKNIIKRYVVDTFGYLIFWSGITIVIQLYIAKISFEKFFISSFIGFLVTLIFAGIYGRFIDKLRNKFEV